MAGVRPGQFALLNVSWRTTYEAKVAKTIPVSWARNDAHCLRNVIEYIARREQKSPRIELVALIWRLSCGDATVCLPSGRRRAYPQTAGSGSAVVPKMGPVTEGRGPQRYGRWIQIKDTNLVRASRGRRGRVGAARRGRCGRAPDAGASRCGRVADVAGARLMRARRVAGASRALRVRAWCGRARKRLLDQGRGDEGG